MKYEELLEVTLKTFTDKLLKVPFAFKNCKVNAEPFKFAQVTLLI